MKKIGLVLEGGGMRGVYTSGVLDFFMENNLYFPYTIGVSAGAGNAVSYISRQIGRSKKATVDSIDDPNYISYRNLIRHGYLFHMDLIFDEMPNKLIPFDYETFYNSQEECIIVASNCETGRPVYFTKKDCKDIMMVCRASSSLPLVSNIVEIDGMPLMDGGVTDSIPIRKSIDDGNELNVLILTRDKEYRKKPTRGKWLFEKAYEKYPKFQEAILNRYKSYNKTLDYIDKLEKENKVFVIRPSEPVKIKRIEKDTEKLTELYNAGYEDAKIIFPKLLEWISDK